LVEGEATVVPEIQITHYQMDSQAVHPKSGSGVKKSDTPKPGAEADESTANQRNARAISQCIVK
jgi:hypothetical protein